MRDCAIQGEGQWSLHPSEGHTADLPASPSGLILPREYVEETQAKIFTWSQQSSPAPVPCLSQKREVESGPCRGEAFFPGWKQLFSLLRIVACPAVFLCRAGAPAPTSFRETVMMWK